MALIKTNKVSYEIQGETLLENVEVAINRGDRIGLIGNNGSGKSTLLKMIAGIINPTSGSINRDGTVSYVPQIDIVTFKKNIALQNYIISRNSRWENVKSTLFSIFHTSDLNEKMFISSLSGGEVTEINLAIAIASAPNVLLLDEPTNHLDVQAITDLNTFLLKRNIPFVIVSHDPFFLKKTTNKIWNLTNHTIVQYGGNYDFYLEQKEIEDAAADRQLSSAKKEYKKIKKSLEKEQSRADRSLNKSHTLVGDRSMSRMEKGYFKNIAGLTAGRNKKKLIDLADKASQKITSLERSTRKKVKLALTADGVSSDLIFCIEDGKLSIGNKVICDKINMTLRGGERIALLGRNGSGKTTLIKSLLRINNNLSESNITGEIYIKKNYKSIYLSQHYEIIDPQKSVLENMTRYSQSGNYETIRWQLGVFLFRDERYLNRKAESLSGGELAKLAFAMILSSNVDVVILDEPTNNIDIETLNDITEGLQSYKGALMVISHNVDFLSKIGIKRSYYINQRELKEMRSNPRDQETYMNEIMSDK